MKIEIKKIVRPLYLRDYAAEYGEAALQVWVNPPRKVMDERREKLAEARSLSAELKGALSLNEEGNEIASVRIKEVVVELVKIGSEVADWLAEIWSQGPEETQMSSEELRAFVTEAEESDPNLYGWMLSETLRMIDEYRAREKKLSAALEKMVESGETTDPYFARIALARLINSACGGAVIAPWEVGELDETWLDAFRVQAYAGAGLAMRKKLIADVKAAWLAKHPTYGKN